MSASFRSHFTSVNSQKVTRANGKSSEIGSSKTPQAPETTPRHGSKLAKKSSRLPTSTEVASRAKTAIPSNSQPTPTTLAQLQDRMVIPGTSTWNLLPPPPTLRTPSLVSGSSVSTMDSPKSNVLRRKASTIGKFVADKRSGALGIQLDRSVTQSRAEAYVDAADMAEDAVFGIPLPVRTIPSSITPVSSVHSDSVYTTTGTLISSTPSTRFADSPFSYAPTPSSLSSISTAPTTYNTTSKLSQEVGREQTISPVELLHQEKARRMRNSILGPKPSALPTSKLSQSAQTKTSITRNVADNRAVEMSGSRKAVVRRSVHPPELAHLNTHLTTKSAGPAPARPSRDGATGLNIAQPTSPVVQSDLTPATFHRRTASRDSFSSTTSSHGIRSRLGLSPKTSEDKNRPQVEVDLDKTSPLLTKKRISMTAKSPALVPTSTPVPPKTSRFGFLTRKSREESAKPVEKPKREPRKMPLAGTGHERYGRFGFGPRNGSVSSLSGGRSPSSDSVSSIKSPTVLRRKSSGASEKTSELDQFLRDRLTPVVLRGGSGSVRSPSIKSEGTETHSLGLTPSVSQATFPVGHISAQPEIVRSGSASAGIIATDPHVHHDIQRPATSTPIAAEMGEGLWLRPLVVEKEKPAKKWSFLQRLQSSPVKTTSGVVSPPSMLRSKFDNAAHSALMDAIEPVDLTEVTALIKEDTISPKAEAPDPSRALLPSANISIHNTSHDDAHKQRDSVERPPALLSTPELGSDSPRIPRLSPIGRIPQVVSKRDRERKLPDVSFSRPFASTQPRPNVKPPGALYNQIRELASPVEPVVQDLSQEQLGDQKQEYVMHSASNLFSWPSRKNSDFSYTSSSDTASWLAYSRLQALQDEDVWDEYDDLMDDAALGKPSRYHKASYSAHQSPPYREPTALQEASYFGLPVAQGATYFGLPPTPQPSAALPMPPKPSRENSSASVPQQGSLYHMTRSMARQSVVSGTSINSSRNSRISTRSRAASFGEANVRSSHTSFSSGTRMNRESIKAQADAHRNGMNASLNLQLESMMTSKLLSFGRVLFSPAHNEMRLADKACILILDGLGSDWSYFVAMFYPQATIYNLRPPGKQGVAREGLQQLPNHRSITHASIDAPLPFPKGFFTAAVFRFPVATNDQAYHSCITEFKRVLRPGGYLEVSVLDIDLSNAGSHARKAIRGLKTRMQQRQVNISLRSLSDFMLQSIGKRGFEGVQRCIIGVPVISRGGPHSDGNSTPDSNSSDGRSPSKLSQYGIIDSSSSNSSNMLPDKAIARLVESASKQDSDESTGIADEESSDEKMTKSVARVGRWWYSQCYERSVLNTDQSIWSDAALLSECRQQGTSFRLLICYAQKPTSLRRRTMSV